MGDDLGASFALVAAVGGGHLKKDSSKWMAETKQEGGRRHIKMCRSDRGFQEVCR